MTFAVKIDRIVQNLHCGMVTACCEIIRACACSPTVISTTGIQKVAHAVTFVAVSNKLSAEVFVGLEWRKKILVRKVL